MPADPVAMLQESPRRLPVQKHLYNNSPKRTLESNSGYAVSAILLLPSPLEYPPNGWLFLEPAILVSSKRPLTADSIGSRPGIDCIGQQAAHKPTVPVRLRLAPGRRSLRGRTELAVVAVTNTISMFRQ